VSLRVATRIALPRPSTAFPALTPHEKLTRLIAVLPPKQATALVRLMDELWIQEQRVRKRQARASLKDRSR
jgi:hypothetical protein